MDLNTWRSWNDRQWRAEMEKAETLIASALGRVDMTQIEITIEWSGRFTSAMGKARSLPGNHGLVRLSKPLWPLASEDEREDTILHELAHILDFKTRAVSFYGRRQPHGRAWQRWMRRLGRDPERTHRVGLDLITARREAKRQRKVGGNGWLLTCDCGTPIRIGPKQASMLRRGTRTYRHRCGRPITAAMLARAEPR